MHFRLKNRFNRHPEYDFREDDSDYYTQPGELFRAMTPDQQQVCLKIPPETWRFHLQIKHRHIYNCYQADKYGEGVAKH